MKPISVCDCETDPFMKGRVPAPFLWGWFDGSEYKEFKSTAEFLEFISGWDGICYAHNGGKFDFHYLYEGLEPFDDIMIINGRIAKMFIGLCEFRDSYNIIPVPLSAYKKDEIDYGIFEESERIKPKNQLKISRYLKSDCVYLFELVSRFYLEYGANLTQAGASLKQWTKICKVKAPKTDQAFYDQFSVYYYGGRVECFRAGIVDTHFSVFDINSAYPFAMLSKHPISSNYSQKKGLLRNADFIRVRCRSHGAFPYRGLGGIGNVDFGLRFPCDDERREYTVTKWEFDAALDTDTIKDVEVLESFAFVNHVDFVEYIQHFYNKRMQAAKAGDEAGRLLYKLAMNSLYGKFAANPAKYRNYMICPMDKVASLPGTGWQFGGELGQWALAEAPLSIEQMRYYNVATGASITGFVRAMLWRALKASSGLLYCDTDSIAVERKGASIVLGEQLGQWKHEGDFDKAGIGGKKLYIFRGVPDAKGKREYKTASKGVQLTNAELWEVAKGGSVTYESDSPTYTVKARDDGKGAQANIIFTKRKVVRTAATLAIRA